MANASGLGGGSVIVPCLILFLDFDPKITVPIANLAVFCGTFTKSTKEVTERHPDKDRPLIDWNLSLLFIIPVIIGTKLGVFINMVIPSSTLQLIGATALVGLGINTWHKSTE